MEALSFNSGPRRTATRNSLVASAVLSVLLLLTLRHPLAIGAVQSKPTDYQVKAAFLFQLGGFVQWTGQVAADPFTICILGRDPFGNSLDSIVRDEMIGNARVETKRIARVQEATECRILFIASSEEARLGQILASLEKSAVVTVSDIQQFVEQGGMVQFVLENNRVRFSVNLAPAQRAGLMFSSQLLKLATRVRGG